MSERNDRQVSRNELTRRVAAAFEANKTAPAAAKAVAEALVQAEIDGQRGHGLSRVESYAAQAASGKVNGFAEATVERRKPGALLVDADHGFAYPAINAAMEALNGAANETGIAAAAIHRSHHCGAVGWHCERLADRGLLAMFFANTPKAMAPWGGSRALFGTNPIAFAAPRRAASPIVIDLALSTVARGKILTAAQAGEPIPEGWAVDVDGNPTTDAKAALAGTLTPIGDAKGAALALMVELLAVTLAGANFAREATSFFDADGNPPGVGQLILAIDPDAFTGRDTVLNRIEDLAADFADNGTARLPGANKAARRAEADRAGIDVDGATLALIQRLARGA